MQKLLIKWTDNWADEVDVFGHTILTQDSWDFFCEAGTKILEEKFTIYVGTNEDIDYSDFGDFLEKIKVIKVSEDQAKFYTKHFGKNYGNLPIDQIIDSADGEFEEISKTKTKKLLKELY